MYPTRIMTIAVIFLWADAVPRAHAAPEGPRSVGGDAKLTPNLFRDLRVEAKALETTDRRHRVIVSLGMKTPRALDPLSGEVRRRTSMVGHQVRVAARQADFAERFASLMAERLIRKYRNIPAMALSLTAGEIRQLAGHPMVESIGRMEVYRTASTESHPLAGVDVAHAAGFLGQGVRVAIIDDGIQADHPAFGGENGFPTSRIVGGFDFGDNDADPRNDCPRQSHGTQVAGIVAGNGGGVTGVAPEADIVFLKLQSAGNCGQWSLDGDLVGAIDWVVTHRSALNIGVLSMSLGSGGFSTVDACENSSPSLTNILNQADAAGIVTLAASGNDGFCSKMGRPACVGSVISVGATYDTDLGNRGAYCVSPEACVVTPSHGSCGLGLVAVFEGTTFPDKVTVYSNSASFLDLLAPSDCAFTSSTQSGTNDCFAGTSAATPFVAGTAALVLQAAGGWNAFNRSQMLTTLRDNGDNVTDGRMNRTTPRVNAGASVNAVGGTSEICNAGDGAVDCAAGVDPLVD